MQKMAAESELRRRIGCDQPADEKYPFHTEIEDPCPKQDRAGQGRKDQRRHHFEHVAEIADP